MNYAKDATLIIIDVQYFAVLCGFRVKIFYSDEYEQFLKHYQDKLIQNKVNKVGMDDESK